MGLNRNEQITLAESVRSAILEVTRRSNEPLTVHALCRHSTIQHYFANTIADTGYIDRLVRGLWKAGWLRRVHVSRPKEPGRYAYEYQTVQQKPEVNASKKTPDLPPDLKLDVLKASGRVRITYHGLTIEIGVSNL